MSRDLQATVKVNLLPFSASRGTHNHYLLEVDDPEYISFRVSSYTYLIVWSSFHFLTLVKSFQDSTLSWFEYLNWIDRIIDIPTFQHFYYNHDMWSHEILRRHCKRVSNRISSRVLGKVSMCNYTLKKVLSHYKSPPEFSSLPCDCIIKFKIKDR